MSDIRDCQPQLDDLLARRAKPKPKQSAATAGGKAPRALDLDNAALIEVGRRSNPDLAALLDGDWSAYPSHSEGRMALLTHLAFWTGGDPARMDGIYRSSGMMNDKWDRLGESEIAAAIDFNGQNYYTGKAPDPREGRQGARQTARRQVREAEARAAEAPDPLAVFLDWQTVWNRDHTQSEWLFSDVLAWARGHSIYAERKQGKSLFMLWLSVQLATGDDPVVVVYLDYEMTEDDVCERLEDMGYGPESDLSRLRYALLPMLSPLDTAEGARELMELVDTTQAEWPDHHVVVIIDTICRAVDGAENDADTFRAFYNHTGAELKRRGVTWARLDHAGKVASVGQRGSSSKGDDVDVVWKLTRVGDRVSLHCDFARMSWVPRDVVFTITECPLAYTPVPVLLPTGTGEVIALLNRLHVPLDANTRIAQDRLKSTGNGHRRAVIVAAMKLRKEQEIAARGGEFGSGNHPSRVVPGSGNHPSGAALAPNQEPPGTTPLFEAGTTAGTTGNHPSRVVVPGSLPLRREPGPPDPPSDQTGETQ